MKNILIIIAALAILPAFAQESKRKPEVVKAYIEKCVGREGLAAIEKNEGGRQFLKTFFADQEWMEQFAGSGPWSCSPWRKSTQAEAWRAAKSLAALDLLVWNDKDEFITSTKLGRNIATALALDQGGNWSDEKIVQVMECYREWAKDGTLHDVCRKYDVREWRTVLGFGQNEMLPVEDLRWIHEFANVPANRFGGVCWQCSYRLWNCFGASVHGSDYYRPWQHRWFTQELRYRVGGVCGALSKFGSHAAASHGVRSFTAGQPGHCAYMLWNYGENRWDIAYAVTGHTGAHFSLGGPGFAASEEQERYFQNPKRMNAEYARWLAVNTGKPELYEKSMRLCPINYQAAKEWEEILESTGAGADKWETFAAALRDTFVGAPGEGWQLYFPYLKQVKGRSEKIEAARKGLLAFRESDAKTVEPIYLDESVLDPLFKELGSDRKAVAELAESMLDGQAKTPSCYRQTINWLAGKLMDKNDPASTKSFMAMLEKSAAKTGSQLDYKGMILTASQSGDIAMFKQVYSMMDKLSPKSAPQANGKKWPLTDYGNPLLSPDGMLVTSGTSGWDNPVNYRNALTPEGFKAGNAFHTDKTKEPWGEVVLAGDAMVSGVTVVNAGGGQNGPRQVPLKIWLSEDNQNWTEVFKTDQNQDEWKVTLSSPVKARYVKVGRVPDAKEEVFHLYKILVYGKKLY